MKYIIYAGWLIPNRIIGYLYIEKVNGVDNFSFEYEKEWLKEYSITFDPEIELFLGRQYSCNGVFGFLKDISPDRWGRLLLDRNEVNIANKEGRKPKKFTDTDYILGVSDYLRCGGIRIALEDNTFISSEENVIPPFSSLRKLEDLSHKFESNINELDDDTLKILLNPGSSLGGARPKANILDESGECFIAKFPSKKDEYDVEAFEALALNLAKMCDINVPSFRLEKYKKNASTLLVKRFDRDKDNRIHFSSAMNLLNKNDMEDASYLDIADIIIKYSNEPKKDLKELFKRLVFNIAISNTDDHLRNHGFLLVGKYWRLSPVFDINPSVYGDSLSLSIDGFNKQLSFDNAFSVHSNFMLEEDEALNIINNIKTIVENNWKKIAKKYLISNEEIKLLESAFSFNDK